MKKYNHFLDQEIKEIDIFDYDGDERDDTYCARKKCKYSKMLGQSTNWFVVETKTKRLIYCEYCIVKALNHD